MTDFQTTLNRFFLAAADICNEILDFQPDVVIGLMHAGWLPLYAGRELWQRTQKAPFPPIVRANLGREKLKRFDDLENRPGVSTRFVGQYDSDESLAFFLAWLYDQTHWQEELRILIEESTGGISPKCILVVDEFISEGSTWLLTLGLLNLIYPQVRVRFYNANIEFKDAFLMEWINTQHPELLRTNLISPNERLLTSHPSRDVATQMVLGIEDVDIESLYWKVIGPPHAGLTSLSEYLPVSTWMELPRFVEQAVSRKISACSSSYIPKPGMTKDRYPELKQGILVMREIYRRGPLTQKQIGEHLGWPIGKVRYHVDRQIGLGYLVKCLEKRVNRIALSPRTKPEYWHEHPQIDMYWVLPGRLLAGDSPGHSFTETSKEVLISNLRTLLDMGVTFFIDLCDRRSGCSDRYERDLTALASERKKDVLYFPVRIPPQQLPTAEIIQSVLDLIDQALEEGHIIYIHDNYVQATETVLGCYFVQHGMEGSDALQELERLREGCRDSWRRAPAPERARSLVRNWHRP